MQRTPSSTVTHSREIGGWRIYAGAGALYTLLAIALTFPLILHLSSVVPHDLGDPLLSTAILWWNAHVVPFTERWWNGLAFYPATGFLAFSDPRLGESLMASPLQWLGVGPVTAYNLTFLATFPLSALAAHWLGYVLTRRHDAALVAGLVYGFCPFRGAHLSHLELLAAFGMPAALAALHLYVDSGRRRWLVVFAASLVVQGLCSSYYLLFFGVLVGAWILWFARLGELRRVAGIAVAGFGALVLLSPLMLGYARIHAHYGLARSFNEILHYSADAKAFIAADPGLLIWGWTARWGEGEGLLFPGLTVTLLVLLGAAGAWQREHLRDRVDRLSVWVLAMAVVCGAVAAAGWAFGPWRLAIPGLTVSSDSSYKTFTIGVWLSCVWLGMSSPVRVAYARRSFFAFYTLAALLLLLCSMGPKPTFGGHEFFYKPPYAWLMNLPGFDSVRVPARFGMPAMLALAAAGAAAFNRIRFSGGGRRTAAVVLCAFVLADGWLSPITLAALPDRWPPSRAEGFTAVIELPFGDLFGDLAAGYRAIDHGRPTLNGSSGFEPTHYSALRAALAEQDPTAFDWLPSSGRLLAVLDTRAPSAGDWDRFLAGHPRITPLAPEAPWAFYALDPPGRRPAACAGDRAPIDAMTFNGDPVNPRDLADGDSRTFWGTPKPQRMGDTLVLDLGEAHAVCGLRMALGSSPWSYPRRLVVETSIDAVDWLRAAETRSASLAIRAAIDDPRRVSFVVPMEGRSARYVRVRLDEDHESVPWIMTDLDVLRTDGARR